MPTPFGTWTEQDAQKAVQGAVHPLTATNRKFVDGDHWQGGDGWVGPRPGPNEPGGAAVLDEIARAFVSRNAIREVVDRHAAGVLGKTPAWGLVPRRPMAEDEEPTPAEQALIDEAEAALTAWWDQRGVATILERADARLLWAARSSLRLYVPPALTTTRTETGADGEERTVTRVEARDLADALAKLHLADPEPEQCAVVTDPATQRTVGIYVVEDAEKKVTVELVYLGETPDGNGVYPTVIRVLKGDQADEAPLVLGGRLTIDEVERPLLITGQVQQAQRALNLALSMLPRTVVTGGFLERVILNAQMPGEWVPDATAPGGQRFKPAEFQTGAGTTNFLVGVPTEDPSTGKKTVASPSVAWRPPVEVSAPIEAKDAHYADILSETQQAHVVMNAEATPSGRSRAEARADYATSLTRTAQREQRRGQWLLETALAMAEAILGTPGKYTDALRATYECRLDIGPVDPETARAIAERVEKGLLSRESGMALLGVEDVGAELARLAGAPTSQLDLLTRQAQVITALTGAGVELEAAAKLAGMTEDQLKILRAMQGDVVPPEPKPRPPKDAPGSGGGGSA